jgi:hypothetical protein
MQCYQRCLVDRCVVFSSGDRQKYIQGKVNTASTKIEHVQKLRVFNIKSSIFKVFTLTAINHMTHSWEN